MLEPTGVTVNGREYTVNPFNPMAAFEFLHLYTAAKNNRQNSAALGMKAIGQCVTPGPEYRRLAETGAFEQWFNQYPEDLFILEQKALEELIRPFFPPQRPTVETATN